MKTTLKHGMLIMLGMVGTLAVLNNPGCQIPDIPYVEQAREVDAAHRERLANAVVEQMTTQHEIQTPEEAEVIRTALDVYGQAITDIQEQLAADNATVPTIGAGEKLAGSYADQGWKALIQWVLDALGLGWIYALLFRPSRAKKDIEVAKDTAEEAKGIATGLKDMALKWSAPGAEFPGQPAPKEV